jgi:hypothetical protein
MACASNRPSHSLFFLSFFLFSSLRPFRGRGRIFQKRVRHWRPFSYFGTLSRRKQYRKLSFFFAQLIHGGVVPFSLSNFASRLPRVCYLSRHSDLYPVDRGGKKSGKKEAKGKNLNSSTGFELK